MDLMGLHQQPTNAKKLKDDAFKQLLTAKEELHVLKVRQFQEGGLQLEVLQAEHKCEIAEDKYNYAWECFKHTHDTYLRAQFHTFTR